MHNLYILFWDHEFNYIYTTYRCYFDIVHLYKAKFSSIQLGSLEKVLIYVPILLCFYIRDKFYIFVCMLY